MPNSFVVRPATLSDSEGIAQVHTRAWQSAYRGLLPDEWLDALRWQDRKTRWDAILSGTATRVYVAINKHEEIVGFASIGPCRDEDPDQENFYELYAIYLSPEIWGSGVGVKLLHAIAKEIPKDFLKLSLWVLKDNARGRKFYENQGFILDGTSKMANIDGYQLEEIRYKSSLPLALKV